MFLKDSNKGLILSKTIPSQEIIKTKIGWNFYEYLNIEEADPSPNLNKNLFKSLGIYL
jgi:hypothetical protein